MAYSEWVVGSPDVPPDDAPFIPCHPETESPFGLYVSDGWRMADEKCNSLGVTKSVRWRRRVSGGGVAQVVAEG